MGRTPLHSGGPPAAEKLLRVLSLLPRRNLRRALFLLLALLGVLAIKHAGGGSFGHLFEALGPTGGAAAPTPPKNDRSYHLRVAPPP
jgi:hypothetical protein